MRLTAVVLLLVEPSATFSTTPETPEPTPQPTPTPARALDIIVGNDGKVNVLLRNQGDGTFIDEELPADPLQGIGYEGTRGLAVADFNGDLHLDVVLANSISNSRPNQVQYNDGNGRFLAPVGLPFSPNNVGGSESSTSVAAGDVNGDGAPDIVFGQAKNFYNQLLINKGNGTFAAPIDLPGGTLQAEVICMGDVDGDSMLDIVVANDGAPNQILLNDGAGNFDFALDLPSSGEQTYALDLGDVNGDGSLDIVTGNGGGSATEAPRNYVLFGDGAGSFTPFQLDIQADTYSLVIGDVDDDGRNDIIFGNLFRTLKLLRNVGDAESLEFAPPVDLAAVDFPYDLKLGDVNADNHPDLVVGISGGENFVLLNDGEGSFGGKIELPGGKLKTYAIALLDVDS